MSALAKSRRLARVSIAAERIGAMSARAKSQEI